MPEPMTPTPSSITFGIARDEPWAEELDTTDLMTPDPDITAAFGG